MPVRKTMSEIELEVSKEVANSVVDELEEKAQRYENVLQSFRSNSLSDTEHYDRLFEDQEALYDQIEDIEEQIDDQQEDGLGELFG